MHLIQAFPRGRLRMPAFLRSHTCTLLLSLAATLLTCVPNAQSQSAYVRVSQVGYEAGHAPFRAYLMSTASAADATFKVSNSTGRIVHEGKVGALLGTWSTLQESCLRRVRDRVHRVSRRSLHNLTGPPRGHLATLR